MALFELRIVHLYTCSRYTEVFVGWPRMADHFYIRIVMFSYAIYNDTHIHTIYKNDENARTDDVMMTYCFSNAVICS